MKYFLKIFTIEFIKQMIIFLALMIDIVFLENISATIITTIILIILHIKLNEKLEKKLKIKTKKHNIYTIISWLITTTIISAIILSDIDKLPGRGFDTIGYVLYPPISFIYFIIIEIIFHIKMLTK